MGSNKEIRKRRGPDTALSAIAQKRLRGEKQGLLGEFLPDKAEGVDDPVHFAAEAARQQSSLKIMGFTTRFPACRMSCSLDQGNHTGS